MQRKESSCFDLMQPFGYLKRFHDNKYKIDKIFHTFLSLAFTNHNPIDGKCDYSIMLLTNNELIWNINYTRSGFKYSRLSITLREALSRDNLHRSHWL